MMIKGKELIKVLVFGMTDNPGGMESTIMNYYRFIDKERFNFDFLCNTEKIAYEDEIKKMGGKIYRVTARSKNVRLYKEDMKRFFSEHAREYDVIWVNVCSLANIDYLIYAKRYGIRRRIIHCHNSKNMDSWKRGLLHAINKRKVGKYATDFWSCADSASPWFYNKKIISSKKYKIVYNAIDTKEFEFNMNKRNEYRRKIGANEKDVIVGNVGRLHFQKNQSFLIKIFKRLVDDGVNAKLWLVGEGPDKQRLEAVINDLGLSERVKILGVRNDVSSILQAMDLFVFPSVFEGFGTALVEAQYSGLSVYASKGVIPSEVKISDKIKFIPLKDGDKKWASVIYDDIQSKIFMNRDCIHFINADYDIRKQVKRMENLLYEK